MIEAVSTSETSVYFNETTECCHLQTRRRENVKFHVSKIVSNKTGGLDINQIHVLWHVGALSAKSVLDIYIYIYI
jgi:transposase-like protein